MHLGSTAYDGRRSTVDDVGVSLNFIYVPLCLSNWKFSDLIHALILVMRTTA
jgi:hypothetical protein